MNPFRPLTDGNGNCQTTSVTLSASASAIITFPQTEAQHVRVDFSGANMVIQFVPVGGSAPAVDATKGITYQGSAIEIISLPDLASGKVGLVASGSGTVRFTAGVGL